MIARLRGTLIHKDSDTVVVDVGGVGYELSVSVRDLDALPPIGDEAILHVHTHVREDALQLFGFAGKGDKLLFQRLTSVSGIGPKIAIAALGVMSAVELRQAIMSADQRALSRIPGVGKKTAQRIILELAEKLAGVDLDPTQPGGSQASGPFNDVFLALTGLGYTRREAEQALKEVRDGADDEATAEALLKRALALLRS